MNILKEYVKSIVKNLLNESSNDYSGEYSDLKDFIEKNNLQDEFVNKYSKEDEDLSKDNWDEYVRGELGFDERIISELIGKEYKVFYNEYDDIFIVKRKKTDKLQYSIEQSENKELLDVFDSIGIYTEFTPRFIILLNGNIIGGSTYEIDEDKVYNFDIAILDEYQNYGISTKIIDRIINDAKGLNVKGIKAQVVNNMLFNQLLKKGFKGSIDSDIKYAYLNLKNM